MPVTKAVFGLVLVLLAVGFVYTAVAPHSTAVPSTLPAPSSEAPAPLPSLMAGLGVDNGTTLTGTLVVNGGTVRTVAPHSRVEAIPADELPSLPWAVEARSPSGRVLAAMTVRQGDIWQTSAPSGGLAQRGDAVRVDLSCGRLDIWSGPPLAGPARNLALRAIAIPDRVAVDIAVDRVRPLV